MRPQHRIENFYQVGQFLLQIEQDLHHPCEVFDLVPFLLFERWLGNLITSSLVVFMSLRRAYARHVFLSWNQSCLLLCIDSSSQNLGFSQLLENCCSLHKSKLTSVLWTVHAEPLTLLTCSGHLIRWKIGGKQATQSMFL